VGTHKSTTLHLYSQSDCTGKSGVAKILMFQKMGLSMLIRGQSMTDHEAKENCNRGNRGDSSCSSAYRPRYFNNHTRLPDSDAMESKVSAVLCGSQR
jgi:hypothetical protein